MQVEQAFEVTIPDERASRMVTVGDVYELLVEATADGTLSNDRCLTAAVFYELRRNLGAG